MEGFDGKTRSPAWRTRAGERSTLNADPRPLRPGRAAPWEPTGRASQAGELAGKVARQLSVLPNESRAPFEPPGLRQLALASVLGILDPDRPEQLARPAVQQAVQKAAPERLALWEVLLEQVSVLDQKAVLSKGEREVLVDTMSLEVQHHHAPEDRLDIENELRQLLSALPFSEDLRDELERATRS